MIPNMSPNSFLLIFLVLVACAAIFWLKFGRSLGMKPSQIFAVPKEEGDSEVDLTDEVDSLFADLSSLSGPHTGKPTNGNGRWVIQRGTEVLYPLKGRRGFSRAVVDGFRQKKGFWWARMTNWAGGHLSRPVEQLQPPKK